ncbi:MAG: heavy metal translocating P-type ATPase [Acidobacteriota bacterium]
MTLSPNADPIAPVAATRPACPACEIHAESIFRIEGMDCPDEVAILNQRLKGLPGLERVTADVVTGRLRVAYDAARLSTSVLATAIAETGMQAWLEHDEATRVVDPRRHHGWLALAVSGACVAAGLATRAAGAPAIAATVLFGAAIVSGGWFWARRAWSAARFFSLDINALMLLAVVGAIAINEWSEAAMVTFLFAVAQWLESRNMERARLAIRALMELAPNEALVRRDGVEQRVRVDQVCVDEVVVVRPGEKVPLDGVVASGTSDVNQAPITGESVPVQKEPGSVVYAGTINGLGAIDVRVTHLRTDSTLARIMALVEHAQSERAEAQTFVERFARVYTPVVVALAVGLAVAPPLLLAEPFGAWFYRALVMLVISCPCALVISTPVSIVSALAGAARHGVLIKGGRHLETLGRVQCVAFDKTGTLTGGVPEVVGIEAFDGASVRDVIGVAAALESHSGHPLARAILSKASRDGVAFTPASDHRALPGFGVSAVLNGEPVLIGSPRMFAERALSSPAVDATVAALSAHGQTVVLVARSGRAIGAVAAADQARDAGHQLVHHLKRHGVAHVAILTGDSAATAERLARDLGVTDTHAGLLPADKVAVVRMLKAAHGVVAMVGDGVNDAPALAAADVGIAMGAAGSDAALETADIALMADDLSQIPYAVRLSRATVRNIRVNIAIALGLKAVFLVLAAAGSATLWMAVVADMGASLLVIGNGLRLLRFE